MMKWFLLKILRARWVAFGTVDQPQEVGLGFQVCGVVMGLYKGDIYFPSSIAWIRPPAKREFGESLHPMPN